jgi:hypothetical protein
MSQAHSVVTTLHRRLLIPNDNTMKNYKVKYRHGNIHGMRTLTLRGGTESEAIYKLNERGSVPRDADVIILSIEPV